VLATVVGCIVLTQAIGFAGTWRVLGQKTAPFLRNE
jgi:predicted lysophospholipase L1 biosynthesis ABC-type transport system permease subunit